MEVVSPGQGANGHPPSSPGPAIINPDLIVRHLVDLLEITLGASKEDLEGKGSILSESKKSDTVQRCTRFASESQVALYVQKDVVTPDEPNVRANGHVLSGMPHIIQQIYLTHGIIAKSFVQSMQVTTSTRCLRRFRFLPVQSPPWPS